MLPPKSDIVLGEQRMKIGYCRYYRDISISVAALIFKRPLQSRESRLPDHSHHHTPRADLHSHQYRHSYRPRALGRLCHTIVHSRAVDG